MGSPAQLELLCSQNVIQPLPMSEAPNKSFYGQLPQTVLSTGIGMPNGESKIVQVLQALPSQLWLPASTCNQTPIRSNKDMDRGDSLVASTIKKFATDVDVARKVMERSAAKSGVGSLSTQECPSEACGASTSHSRKSDVPKSLKSRFLIVSH